MACLDQERVREGFLEEATSEPWGRERRVAARPEGGPTGACEGSRTRQVVGWDVITREVWGRGGR